MNLAKPAQIKFACVDTHVTFWRAQEAQERVIVVGVRPRPHADHCWPLGDALGDHTVVGEA